MRGKSKTDFGRIFQAMAEGKAFTRTVVDFSEACALLKVGRVELENMIYESFGMSGEDVMVGLRRRRPRISH